MTPPPTGRLFPTATGTDLVLTRTFRAPLEDVWASVTESDRTARWFGPWEGDAGPGRTVKVQMAFEEQQPWMDLHIDACEAPRRLAVSAVDDTGRWRLELLLSETDGRTELRLVHHLDTTDGVGEIGPGWEYYLDMLVAARDGTPRPAFDDYYPAMAPYFAGLAPAPTT
ncbi:SRPBCC family protein [Dactylosporangium roseum]|uniref:SRPBCC family protein n=1 Tax=Dactylosporangium roseum TaxID=47989 RepID=A0ABY5Z9R4_9ACTN|nr:SRPBCC family protein [Dactylosporangium roseum]UWZ37109.1 SRPBCC family protein [Dactylosporangium roseum]